MAHDDPGHEMKTQVSVKAHVGMTDVKQRSGGRN